MNYRKPAALLLLFMLAAVPMMAAPAVAASSGGQTEKLSAYISGSDAFWSLTLGNINATNSYVTAADSVSGVSWYNLTAISTVSAPSDFQQFGPGGYNLVPVPFIPAQGAFLTVGASSFSAASSVASVFDTWMTAAFVSYSNDSGSFTFYSPLTFNTIVPVTLYELMPANKTGFAAGVSTTTALTSLPSPIMTLESASNGGGFTHSLIISSLTTSGLDASGRPAILDYFGGTLASLTASNDSASSSITVTALDGRIYGGDSYATVTNSPSSFTGTYTLPVSAGASVYRLNATVEQVPPAVLATRVIDSGGLSTGQNFSVTISVKDLSNLTTVTTFNVNDSWWSNYGFFKVVSGSSDMVASGLAPGDTQSPTYVLEYTGSTPTQVTIPPVTAHYSYTIGPQTVNASTTINGAVLSLGGGQPGSEPALYAYVQPQTGFDAPVGATTTLQVVARNVGFGTALNVSLGGKPAGDLISQATASVSFNVTSPSITQFNVSKSYMVSYGSADGQSFSFQTNTLTTVFTHSAMRLGFLTLAAATSTKALTGGASLLNDSFTLTNTGLAAISNLVASAPLPSGLQCASASSNVTCSGSSITIFYPSLGNGVTEHDWVSFNVTSPRNYVFAPFSYSYTSSGYSASGFAGIAAAATGLVLSKTYDPNPLFGGMNVNATVDAVNHGPLSVFNATVQSTADAFDSLPSAPLPTVKSNQTIAAGAGLNFTYGLVTGTQFGSALTPTPATATFYFAGTQYTLSQNASSVAVYRPLNATISSNPSSPEEGKSFTIQVNLTNTASVAVSNVQFSLPIPVGVTVSPMANSTVAGGVLKVSFGQMAANSTYTATASAESGSGLSIPFAGSKLSFEFGGATVKGTTPTDGIAIGENILVRYTVPIAVAVLAMLGAALYVRRLVGASAPASQK